MAREKYPTRRGPNMEQLTFEEYLAALESVVNQQVPPRFHRASIEDPRITEYAASFDCHTGLYLYGLCGTGKTHNLYGLYKSFSAYNILTSRRDEQQVTHALPEMKFTTVVEFLASLRAQFDGEDSERYISRAIQTGQYIFLDDFGSEKMTEWTEEIMFRLINHRYEYLKPTFFSSNLSLKELADKVGDRITSRIVQMCEVIKLEGSDKRITKK